MITPPDSAPQAPQQMAASGWDIQAPYAPGSPQAVAGPPGVPGAQADTVAGEAASAMANAQARFTSHQADTRGGAGVDIGQQLNLPVVPANDVPASLSYLYEGTGDEPVPA